MLDISFDHLTSHSVSDCPGKISIFPQLPRPQSLFQSRELAEQSPGTMAFDNPDHISNRPGRGERHQDVNVFQANFQFDNFKPIVLTYFPDQLFRSFLNLRPLKYILPIFRTPDQVVIAVVDRMTRPLEPHALYISQHRARAYADKGAFPVPLITPSATHAFLPAASRGVSCKGVS
jgi:hypothetical protein